MSAHLRIWIVRPLRRRPVFLLAVAFALGLSIPASAQIGGEPGAFSRMGFGARGMAMGNALTAVASGNVASYYNPALLPYAGYRHAGVSFGILSLDRSLNFVQFSQPLPPAAGLAAGIINGGVTGIDGRDGDGERTGELRTTENQAFLAFAAKLRSGLSIGVTLKLLYYHLYTDMTSTTVGVDLGAYLPLGEGIAVGVSVRDINSKYKWDSAPLFGQSGQSPQDRFPLVSTAGVSWFLPDSVLLLSADVEFSNRSTTVIRAGAELPLLPEITLRAGVDRIDLREKGNGVRPGFGFGLRKSIGTWTPLLDYAYVLEPFAPKGLHMISLSVIF
jgi:hypothetical protein